MDISRATTFNNPTIQEGRTTPTGECIVLWKSSSSATIRCPVIWSLDKETGWLYFNETVHGRILRMDTKTGIKLKDLGRLNEPLEAHWEMHEVMWEVFVDQGLVEPVCITVADGTLFVSDHGTGDIIAFDAERKGEVGRVTVGTGIRGITIGPDNKLWFANYDMNQVLRLDPR
ncbi:MAG: hypothetical protein ACNA8W_12350 [Bradymonadaceae bacterium]